MTHVVLFKLKPENREANLAAARERLRAMAGKVQGLRQLEVGENFTDSPRACDLCLVTRFDDRAGLAAYASDPAHVEVKEFLADVVEASYVVDYAE